MEKCNHYINWIKIHENKCLEYIDLEYKPFFSIVVPVENTNFYQLEECIQSILSQTYEAYELILVIGCTPGKKVQYILKKYMNVGKVKVLYKSVDKYKTEVLNAGIGMAVGEYLIFVECTDIIAKDALYCFAEELNKNIELDFIYSDEDQISEDSRIRHEPFFKPDWSPDLFLTFMYTNNLAIYKASILKQIGGFRSAYSGAGYYDMVLRFLELTDYTRIAHIPKVLYHSRDIDNGVNENYFFADISSICKAKEDALQRRGIAAYLECIDNTVHSRIVYEIVGTPLISIIIPTKDNPELLIQCITAIQRRTGYTNYEIIVVDNGSNDQNKRIIEEFLAKFNYKYEYDKQDFNFSRMCNCGVKHSRGEYLLFLNDDIEVIQSDWLNRIVGQAQQDHAGAVGIKLLYPKSSIIQHDGIINISVGPVHLFLGKDDNGKFFFSWNLIDYNCLAVTGACLLINKEKFIFVNGFDEKLEVAYNDVDLCFKLYENGLYNVIRNDVIAYHHESYSRGLDKLDDCKLDRLNKERELLFKRHPQLNNFDPFYSSNFMGIEDFQLRVNSPVSYAVKKVIKFYLNKIKLLIT